MEPMLILAIIIFIVTIALITWGRWDSAVIGLVGAVVMVVVGVMDAAEAFMMVDWNVIAILFSIWVIATYFSKTGVPEYLAIKVLQISRNNISLFLTFVGILAGFLSMFVDNVVVIIIMAPVILHITSKLGLPAFPFLIFTGLSANFMGTALLLGDLPPQMLHSVSGIEFHEFIWQAGRPSSFILLTVTFLVTVFLMYRFKFRGRFQSTIVTGINEILSVKPAEHIKNKKFAIVSVGFFLATILAMSFRQALDYPLGFIALMGMVALVIVNELFAKKLESPNFGDVLKELDWRAVLFYIVLFVLVGGLGRVGVIQMVAQAIAPYIQHNLTLGVSLLYWVTGPVVAFVEHDAYILVFLHLIKDLAATTGINPWPLWWALLWAGTLGSNLTIAGAPALFVAKNICERADSCKVSLKEFLSYSAPFVGISLVMQYVLTLIFWVFPFA